MKPLHLSRPHVIAMVGIPGSGKSFFAEHFAETFGAPLISLSRLRADLFSSPAFSPSEKIVLDKISDYILDELLKTGQTIVFDASTDARGERQELARKARAAGYEPLFVWVQTESAAAKARATGISKSKPFSLTSEQFDNALRRFVPPNETERPVVVSGKHTYASQLKIVLSRLVVDRTSPDGPKRDSRTVPGNRIAIR